MSEDLGLCPGSASDSSFLIMCTLVGEGVVECDDLSSHGSLLSTWEPPRNLDFAPAQPQQW